jgi:tellurite methyltransferase
MSQTERELWNRKFAERSHSSLEADPLLIQAYSDYIDPMLKHSQRDALDVGGGVGRHALYLAERGWQVTLIDVSDVGLEQAKKSAQKRGLKIELCCRDLSAGELGAERYDLVIVFFFLQRELFPALTRALRPGGLLIYKTYTSEHPRLSGGKGPTHPMHLLAPNELLRAFSAMRILYYQETVSRKGVAELVAQKS